jgi:flagellar biogenesis protein FliO
MIQFLLIMVGIAFSQVDSLSNDKFLKVQELVSKSEAAVAPAESVSVGSVILQMVLGLAVIGVLFAVLIFLLKKFKIGQNKLVNDADFQVVQTFWLAQNQKIQLVRIYDKNYLLAVGPSGVQLVDENVQLPENLSAVNSETFSQSVDSLLSKYKKNSLFNKKDGEV